MPSWTYDLDRPFYAGHGLDKSTEKMSLARRVLAQADLDRIGIIGQLDFEWEERSLRSRRELKMKNVDMVL